MNKKLEFTTTLQKIEVTIDGNPYTLKEMDGTRRGQYQTQLSKRTETTGSGKNVKVTIKDMGGMQEELLAFCLFDKNGAPVPAETILKWPSRVSDALYKEAQALNGLETDKEKNARGENEEFGSD